MNTRSFTVKKWRETKYGVDGANIWFLYPGILAMLVPIGLFGTVIIKEDFSGHNDILAVLIFLFLWAFDKFLFALFSIQKVKSQIVNLQIHEHELLVDCYLNKKHIFNKKELKHIQKSKFSFWYLRYSYLSDKKNNYCLTTVGGQKLYISGDMPEVDKLITTLQEIIQSNRNP